MLKQPDLHHDGPITAELVDSLIAKLKAAMDDVAALDYSNAGWAMCKVNWLDALRYAGLRMAAVSAKAQFDLTDDKDRKCVDIVLCILRDYEAAKAKEFVA